MGTRKTLVLSNEIRTFAKEATYIAEFKKELT